MSSNKRIRVAAASIECLSSALWRLLLSFQTYEEDAQQRRVCKLWRTVVDENPDESRLLICAARLADDMTKNDVIHYLNGQLGKSKKELSGLSNEKRQQLLLQLFDTKQPKLAFLRVWRPRLAQRKQQQEAQRLANLAIRREARRQYDAVVEDVCTRLQPGAAVPLVRRVHRVDGAEDKSELTACVVQVERKTNLISVTVDHADDYFGCVLTLYLVPAREGTPRWENRRPYAALGPHVAQDTLSVSAAALLASC